ncbi:kinase-like domain-containing protein [Aspergillus pseudonomiae]|uniref:Kinase-like domain-containing protein n=1 Tax=Aspergillus pseudonomiae TaxID=1506151 RepID=A0A5N7CRN3_9EURO|nr:kinase-like domain-containing protein [Aspergillus pseudonomiae]KAE8396900.1 kinase-like domain-containing protein [Aspergillus pseudonomiae]
MVAHDNTIDHNIVVIKRLRIHAGSRQYGLLRKVSEEKPPNIVRLIDVFTDNPSIHLAYESLETSLHQVQATCHQDITEIELAIIAKEVLHGLRYIHSELQVAYGQLCPRNVLLSYYTCDVKLANIAESIMKPPTQNFTDDLKTVGTLLVRLKEPGTFRRNPENLALENGCDISDYCKSFISQTATLSLKDLINHEFLLKSPGIGRLRIFIYRAMACAARFSSTYSKLSE